MHDKCMLCITAALVLGIDIFSSSRKLDRFLNWFDLLMILWNMLAEFGLVLIRVSIMHIKWGDLIWNRKQLYLFYQVYSTSNWHGITENMSINKRFKHELLKLWFENCAHEVSHAVWILLTFETFQNKDVLSEFDRCILLEKIHAWKSE